jgi:uroporphyrinogen-III synthase
LASAWDIVRDNPLPVVAVGAATEKALERFSIAVCFTPSKANAETLVAELELNGPRTSLLYPASARAKKTLQNGLEARGVEVTRLNTYDTVTANWSEDKKKASDEVKIACFASPSSVKGWLQNTNENKDVIAACIGETSATACRNHGWDESKIFFPENPGIDGWVQAIKDAAASIAVAHS